MHKHRSPVAAAALSVLLTAFIVQAQTSPTQTNKALNTSSVPQSPGDASVPQPAHGQLDSPTATDAQDRSALGSPVPSLPAGDSLALGTPLKMILDRAGDSKTLHNGDKLQGSLAASLRTHRGRLVPQGTRIEATVVSAAPAGTVESFGVLSLQLTRVGNLPILSDVVDFRGQEGHRDVADSAPSQGTEAIVAAGSTLAFKVVGNTLVPGVVQGITPATNAGPGAPAAGQAEAQAASQPARQAPLATPATSSAAGQVPVPTGAPRAKTAPTTTSPR